MRLFSNREICHRIRSVYNINDYETFKIYHSRNDKCLYSGKTFIFVGCEVRSVTEQGKITNANNIDCIISGLISDKHYIKKCELKTFKEILDTANRLNVKPEEIYDCIQSLREFGKRLSKIGIGLK